MEIKKHRTRLVEPGSPFGKPLHQRCPHLNRIEAPRSGFDSEKEEEHHRSMWCRLRRHMTLWCSSDVEKVLRFDRISRRVGSLAL